MAGTVPLISSGVAGPLGAIHLPRLWLKLTLSARGQLADGYPECGMGFDQMVLDGLKVDRDSAVNYVKENQHSYIEFENWIVQQRGGAFRRRRSRRRTPRSGVTTTTMTPGSRSFRRPGWKTTGRSWMRST